MVSAMAVVVEFLYFGSEWAHGELHVVDRLVKDPRNAPCYRGHTGDKERISKCIASALEDTNQFQNTRLHTPKVPTTVPNFTCSESTSTLPLAFTFTPGTLIVSWITNFLLPPSPKRSSAQPL